MIPIHLRVYDPRELQKAAEAAAPPRGLPNRADYGNIERLNPGRVLDLIVQEHNAERAGRHYDVRFGDPELGLFSWALRKGLPGYGEKRLGVRQPVHTHEYGGFEGELPSGYGKGAVKRVLAGRAMVLSASPDKVVLARIDRKYPEIFTFIKPKTGRSHDWLVLNTTPTAPLPYQKVRYGTVDGDKVDDVLAGLDDDASVEAKVDGASTLISLTNHGAHLTSFRTAADTGHPITHTLRFFGGPSPKLSLPPELEGTILSGELYGVSGDPEKAVPPSVIGGILNATVENAIARQKRDGIKLRNMVYDIKRYGKRPVDPATPRKERLAMVAEVLKHLPEGQFHAVDAVPGTLGPQLWQRVTGGLHPLTEEGVMIYPGGGKPPVKAKARQEVDVVMLGTFPGEGNRADTIGGIRYALTGAPDKEVGRVGSGFSRQELSDIASDPGAYVGRRARIRAQEQFPSGALRSPAFLAWHEDYPPAGVKQAGAGLDGAVQQLADDLDLPSDIPLEAFATGVLHELEHGDTVDWDLKTIARIALDHLLERPDYYEVLEKAEKM